MIFLFYCSCYKDPYKDLEESDLIMRLKTITKLNSVFSFNNLVFGSWVPESVSGLRYGILSTLVLQAFGLLFPSRKHCATTRKCPFLFLQQLALLSSFLHFPDYHNICIVSVLGHNAWIFRTFAWTFFQKNILNLWFMVDGPWKII